MKNYSKRFLNYSNVIKRSVNNGSVKNGLKKQYSNEVPQPTQNKSSFSAPSVLAATVVVGLGLGAYYTYDKQDVEEETVPLGLQNVSDSIRNKNNSPIPLDLNLNSLPVLNQNYKEKEKSDLFKSKPSTSITSTNTLFSTKESSQASSNVQPSSTISPTTTSTSQSKSLENPTATITTPTKNIESKPKATSKQTTTTTPEKSIVETKTVVSNVEPKKEVTIVEAKPEVCVRPTKTEKSLEKTVKSDKFKKVEKEADTYKKQSQEYQNKLKEATKEYEKRLSEIKVEYEKLIDSKLEIQKEEYMKSMEQIQKKHKSYMEEMGLVVKDLEGHLESAKETVENYKRETEAVKETNMRYLDSFKELSIQAVALENAFTTFLEAFEKNIPLKPEMDSLKDFVKEDDLLQSVVSSIPESVCRNGAMRNHELLAQFDKVSQNALFASFVPTNQGLYGYLYSKVVSLFVVPEAGFVDGETTNAKLARARYYLQNQKLREAIKEIETIDESSKVVMEDWLVRAKERLVVDQAGSLMKAHLVNLSSTKQ